MAFIYVFSCQPIKWLLSIYSVLGTVWAARIQWWEKNTFPLTLQGLRNRHLPNNHTIKCKITTVIELQREEHGAMRAHLGEFNWDGRKEEGGISSKGRSACVKALWWRDPDMFRATMTMTSTTRQHWVVTMVPDTVLRVWCGLSYLILTMSQGVCIPIFYRLRDVKHFISKVMHPGLKATMLSL